MRRGPSHGGTWLRSSVPLVFTILAVSCLQICRKLYCSCERLHCLHEHCVSRFSTINALVLSSAPSAVTTLDATTARLRLTKNGSMFHSKNCGSQTSAECNRVVHSLDVDPSPQAIREALTLLVCVHHQPRHVDADCTDIRSENERPICKQRSVKHGGRSRGYTELRQHENHEW